MTVEVARRTRRRAAAAIPALEPTIAPPASYAIGEFEQTVFDCPSCSRPLALGARRCPGCRARLVNGVTLSKVSTFTAVGLAVGLLVGGGVGIVFGINNATVRLPATVAPVESSTAPTAATGSAVPARSAPAMSAAPTATPESAIPAVTRSALVQVVDTNGRLATAAADLRAALAASSFDASAVAQTLRSISADTVFGQQLADRLVAWPASAAVGAQLATFYGSVHDTAAEGLDASVRNVAAYRAAATRMLARFGEMAGLDAAVRATATSAGVDLPAAPLAP